MIGLTLTAVDFPTITLERKETELTEILSPEDFAIGQHVFIYDRFSLLIMPPLVTHILHISPFFVYDCDEFTKEFYRRNFGETDFTPIDVSEPIPTPPARVRHVHCS